MKKNLFLIFALVALTTFAFAEFKIGIINPQAVLQNSSKGKEVIERLKSLQLAKQKKYEAMQKEIDTLEKEVHVAGLEPGSPGQEGPWTCRTSASKSSASPRTPRKRAWPPQQKEFEKIQRDLMPHHREDRQGERLFADPRPEHGRRHLLRTRHRHHRKGGQGLRRPVRRRSRRQEMNLPLTIEDIKKILPHRYPFLLVDRVTEVDGGEDQSRATRTSPATRTSSRGISPATRSCPGVLVIEALAQLGAALLMQRFVGQTVYAYFAGIDKARFKRTGGPGRPPGPRRAGGRATAASSPSSRARPRSTARWPARRR